MKKRINQAYVKTVLEQLLAIPSPTGYAHHAVEKVREEAGKLGLAFETTPKGMGIITVPGKRGDVLGLTGHVDTLGAMVRSVNKNGTLRMTPLGGYMMNSIEGEYVQVHTRDGRIITGTVLTSHPSVHVYADAREQKREEANMEVRLDAEVSSREDVRKLGVRAGDIISFDPRTRWANGFLKSRHLDDKAGVASLFGLLELLQREGLTPQKTLKVCITTYEEVGHGASYVPEEIREILAVDMGAMGDDLTCTEQDVSICAKDSSGPYDYELVSKLIRLAERDGISYAVDIYPSYGSDASAALRGGSNLRAALIGPGVHASHSMERTHEEALWNTIALLAAYVME